MDDLNDQPMTQEQIDSILNLRPLEGDEILEVFTQPLLPPKSRIVPDFKHNNTITLSDNVKAKFNLLRSFYNPLASPFMSFQSIKEQFDQSGEELTIEQVFKEVPLWSQENFGNQGGLAHLAPLMGLMEELGELTEAKEDDASLDLIHDAVGDIGVYSIDFLARAGLGTHIFGIWTDLAPDAQWKYSPVVFLSKVFHACLKRHQGIRGFDNTEKYFIEVATNMKAFLGRINCHYALSAHTCTAWKTVRERNWKKNPQGVNNG